MLKARRCLECEGIQKRSELLQWRGERKGTMRAMRGLITMDTPGSRRAGSQKQRLFPPPVGMSTNVSCPERSCQFQADHMIRSPQSIPPSLALQPRVAPFQAMQQCQQCSALAQVVEMETHETLRHLACMHSFIPPSTESTTSFWPARKPGNPNTLSSTSSMRSPYFSSASETTLSMS